MSIEFKKPTLEGQALSEARALAHELLTALEKHADPLSNLVLRACRLAHLVGDEPMERTLTFEATGYSQGGPLANDTYNLAVQAGREFTEETGIINRTSAVYVYTQSIKDLEEAEADSKAQLRAQKRTKTDNFYVSIAQSNCRKITRRLDQRRHFLHAWLRRLDCYLRFASETDNLFSRTRSTSEGLISTQFPKGMDHFSAIYENLSSSNHEDWANAVHSCRRVLSDLSDLVYPPTNEPLSKSVDGKTVEIQLKAENYINRLVAFVESKSASTRYSQVVGSHLAYLGDRLAAVVSAANKGTHASVTQWEANRYAVYTHLLVGDILSLLEKER